MLGCSHARAVPVDSAVTGELLAALCPDCDEQLPADFLGCPHENVIETAALNEPPGRGICNGCGVDAWYGYRPRLIIAVPEFTAEQADELARRIRDNAHDMHYTIYLGGPTTAVAHPDGGQP